MNPNNHTPTRSAIALNGGLVALVRGAWSGVLFFLTMATTKGMIHFNKEVVLRDFVYDLIAQAIESKDNSIIEKRGLGHLLEFMNRMPECPLSELKVYKEFVIPNYGVCDIVVVKNMFDVRAEVPNGHQRYTYVYAIEVKNVLIDAKCYNQICRYMSGLAKPNIFEEVWGCIIGVGFRDSHFICNVLSEYADNNDEGSAPRTYEADFDMNGVSFKERGDWAPSPVVGNDNYQESCMEHYFSNGALKRLSSEDMDYVNKKINQ